MKMAEQHIIPLSRQALELFEDLRKVTGDGKYLFPSVRTGSRPMSDNTLNAALRRLGYSREEMTGHGFRSMASTLLNELGWNRDAIVCGAGAATLDPEIHRREPGITAELHRGVYDMIAKRIDMRDAAKSRATRLAKYVTDELGRAGRVADVFTTNCISDDALLAAKEIEICQARNTRANGDKTFHLLLSFPDGERPDKDQLRAMADETAKALGYGEHQRIAVVHDDTDNLHMHLVINKIHPERLTIHTPRRDFKILAELCAKLERDNSLKKTNHEPIKCATEAKTQDMEAHSGEESFLSYARKEAIPLLAVTQSWETLHASLARTGISLRLKGNGLVMVDHVGAVAVKASAVARDFSKAKLEKRFGAFTPYDASRKTAHHPAPPDEKRLSAYQKTPPAGTESLYQQYRREKDSAGMERAARLAAVWEEQKQAMRRIAATTKQILPKTAPRRQKRALRFQASASANAAIADVRRIMAKKREEIKAGHKPLGYVEWLKREAERGSIPAIYALRKRGVPAPAVVNITARDLRYSDLVAAKIVHVTGRGTLFYKVRQDVFRDNGSHLSLKQDIDEAGIEAALRIAMTKFKGQPLTVNGSNEFRKRCIKVTVKKNLQLAFSDIQMENTRIALLQSASIQCTELKSNEQIIRNGFHREPMKPTRPSNSQNQGMSR